jgi:hypothetical protein
MHTRGVGQSKSRIVQINDKTIRREHDEKESIRWKDVRGIRPYRLVALSSDRLPLEQETMICERLQCENTQ